MLRARAKDWMARPYRSGDEDAILMFLRSIWPGQVKYTMEWWQWLHRENTVGESIIWLAECDGKVVGHLAYIPTVMLIGGREVVAAQAVDGATHAEFQGQGIFRALIERCFEDAGQRRWSYMYGFPNSGAYPVWKLIGASDIAPEPQGIVKNLKVPVGARFWGRSFWRFHIRDLWQILSLKTHIFGRSTDRLSGAALVRETRFGSEYNRFWEVVSEPLRIATVRNAAYLNWRYMSNPLHQFTVFSMRTDREIFCFTVLLCRRSDSQQTGIVLEFMANSDYPEPGRQLLMQALRFFQNEGMDAVACPLFVGWNCEDLFIRSGFVHRKRGVSIIVKALGKETQIPPFLTDRGNWLLTWGDTDDC